MDNSVKQALEMADTLSGEWTDVLIWHLDKSRRLNLERILRHYAEIMQAEPVAVLVEIFGVEAARLCVSAPTGTQLIIKPKPLPEE